MRVFVSIEASQPCGKSHRLALGFSMPLTLVWVGLGLARLI